MECRHPLVPTGAGLLPVAGARVHAGETATPRPLQVAGGDFPGDTSGQWIHADPDPAGQTLYIEAWAD